ncbi:MAG: NAD/NADP octopine/nopaline dehydrogenase family protein [Bacillota bacterium]|nr:NAD/NADP octopine/nopaline dehydrogenase family protein [Bacillota bacterium]
MSSDRIFAVLGAGNGGLAIAGHLALRGYDVRLWNRSPDTLAGLAGGRPLRLQGRVRGSARITVVTTDLAEAVTGAAAIMVVMPATAHRPLARRLVEVVRPGQTIILNPGRTGGALEMDHLLRKLGCAGGVLVAEAQTLVFAARTVGPAVCHVFGMKRRVRLAALPAPATDQVLGLLSPAFPQFVAAEHVIETSLANVGTVFHPGVALLNASRIEATGGDFEYYREGITPMVSRVIRAVDEERLGVARAYGVSIPSAREWLREAYGAEGDTLRQAVLSNPGYHGIKAPRHLDHRYIKEDVPTSLVPVSELGRLAGVGTPTVDGLIALSSALHGVDYRREGRSAARMGIAGMTPAQILALVRDGR